LMKLTPGFLTHKLTIGVFGSRGVDDGDTLSDAKKLIRYIRDLFCLREELVSHGKWLLVPNQLIAESWFTDTFIVKSQIIESVQNSGRCWQVVVVQRLFM
jgi:hypothetical protein